MDHSLQSADGVRKGSATSGEVASLHYLSGFNNELSSEAIPGTLPIGQNSPQRIAHGLLHEVVSATAFTAPRSTNRRSHLYRIRPSAAQPAFKPRPGGLFLSAPLSAPAEPNQVRWGAFTMPSKPQDFLDGMVTLCANGSAAGQTGIAMHVFLANRSMKDRVFSNGDGELLIVPDLGGIRVTTEIGILEAHPGEIVLVPRGCKMRVDLLGEQARGYVCENYGVPFQLPDLGLIGSTGQANAWDFQVPVAAFEDCEVSTQLVHKLGDGCGRQRWIIHRSMS